MHPSGALASAIAAKIRIDASWSTLIYLFYFNNRCFLLTNCKGGHIDSF